MSIDSHTVLTNGASPQVAEAFRVAVGGDRRIQNLAKARAVKSARAAERRAAQEAHEQPDEHGVRQRECVVCGKSKPLDRNWFNPYRTPNSGEQRHDRTCIECRGKMARDLQHIRATGMIPADFTPRRKLHRAIREALMARDAEDPPQSPSPSFSAQQSDSPPDLSHVSTRQLAATLLRRIAAMIEQW